jgi:hypothetical protein
VIARTLDERRGGGGENVVSSSNGVEVLMTWNRNGANLSRVLSTIKYK